MSHLWGIDLGGTKIEGIVLRDGERPDPLARIRIDTQADRGYRHVLERIAELVSLLESETGLKANAIGIGTPGSRNPHTGLMRNCNTTCLNGMPLLEDLIARLGLNVVMANDANCFALAESRWGAARGHGTVFGVILGTGVGGGLVVDGKVLEGANGIAGEWGHTIFEVDGPPCYCGRTGCVETFLSGPANERVYFDMTGKRMSFREIARRAKEENDPAAIEILGRYNANFGRAIAQVINVFDPHAIVLGGGVGRLDTLCSEARAEAAKWVFSDRFDTVFVQPELGDSAGVFGAALLRSRT